MRGRKNRELWQGVLSIVERKVGAAPVDTWLRSASLVDADREQVVIAVASPLARERVEGRLASAVADAFEALIGHRPAVRVEVDASAGDSQPEMEPVSGAVRAPSPSPSPAQARPSGRIARVRPAAPAGTDAMSFESFVVGAGNRTAFRAAEKVCESPGDEDQNPFLITGPEGTGKTHLLRAIARRLSEQGAGKVVFATAEEFANQLFAGIRSSLTERFRERWRKADALVIDDFHLLQTKRGTQLEFLHTFDELIAARKQVVVSSQVTPNQVKNLNEGLAGRICGGLFVSIEPPDLETRRRVCEMLARRQKVALPRDLSEFLVRNVTGSVRNLVAAITRLEAHAAAGGRLDVPLARRKLVDLIGPRSQVRPEELIVRIVAERCGTPAEELRGDVRRRGTARARQVAIYLIRELTELSLTEIGRFFGREPSTVKYAEVAVARLIVGDDRWSRVVEECRQRFEDER